MESVFFEPWIGSDYCGEGFKGKKILVIGNSHYCPNRNSCSNCGVCGGCFDDDCSDFTTTVVNDYLDRSSWKKWMSTYQKFERALCGYSTDEDDSRNIWNSIAFYNYLQTAVPYWNDPGNDEDYEASEDAFWEVLEELRPDCIIMWGNRVWDMTPGYNNSDGDCYELSDGTEIPVLGISHPSWRYFKWNKVNGEISSFLNNL